MNKTQYEKVKRDIEQAMTSRNIMRFIFFIPILKKVHELSQAELKKIILEIIEEWEESLPPREVIYKDMTLDLFKEYSKRVNSIFTDEDRLTFETYVLFEHFIPQHNDLDVYASLKHRLTEILDEEETTPNKV